MITTTRPNLRQLRTELAAAGVPVSGLGAHGEPPSVTVHTYNAAGEAIDLPPAAQSVLNAHVPPAPPDPPDYGGDAPSDYERQLAAAVTNLRAFLAAPNPNNAQVVAALKLNIRVTLAMARRVIP